MSIANISVIGVGGVGGYFGAKLCRLQDSEAGVRVSFVARGEHLRVIQESGLQVSTESEGELVARPSLATDDLRRLPRPDLLLICVKVFDLPAVLDQLEPMITGQTLVLPLLNGVDVPSRIRQTIRTGIVLPACVYVGTHIDRPGRVVQRGGACRILFGSDPQQPEGDLAPLVALLARAGIRSEWRPDIQMEIWKKFIFIGAYGLVSAAHDKSLGEILADDALRSEVQAVIGEAVALAGRAGVALPQGIAEASFLKARDFPFEARTSFQRDFQRPDREDERDLFVGTMVRMGDELKVDVPRAKALGALLDRRKPGRSGRV